MNIEVMEVNKKNNRFQLLIILLTPILVIISSTGLYFSGWLTVSERSNQGYLISPVLSITDFGLPVKNITQDRQWQLIQFSKECSDACLSEVLEQRQMHIALGKYQDRLTRLLITDTTLNYEILKQYPNLQLYSTNDFYNKNKIEARIPKEHLLDNPVFVSDPFGNVMLYFTQEQDYKAQMKDLKKLLKLSTIG